MAISLSLISELLKNSSYFFKFCDATDSVYKNCKDLLNLYHAEQELECILCADKFKIDKKQALKTFQFDTDDITLTLRLLYSLCFRYLYDNEFTSIRMQADTNNKYGYLSMDEYFITPSYIPEFDLRKRETLIKAETEESHVKIDKSLRKLQNFLPHSYLSNSLFNNVKRIVITGNPGVGKSTYARWLCYSWAKQQLGIKGILVHVNLRELNFSSGNSLVDYVSKRYLKNSNANQLRKILSTIAIANDFYFVLDGFDELDDNKQKQLKRDLDELNSDFKFILLSRPYGLINNQGFNWDFSYQIDGFNSGNIENYINKFLARNNRQETVQSLLDIIYQNRVLADYAHNPLMLSYITYLFLEDGKSRNKLIRVQSQYELQDTVYGCIRAYEETKHSKEDLDSLIDKASVFAYQMEINKQIVFNGKITDVEFRRIAEYLNRIGLGKMYQSDIAEWKYSFNSLTFQEFLATKHLVNYITTDAFLYLSGEKYFMNLIRMLIGCLSLNNQNVMVDEILQSLYTQFQNNNGNLKLWGIYIICLSEVSKEYLIEVFSDGNKIKELYNFYYSLYHDEQYQSIVLDAVLRVYSKLNLSQQIEIQNIIIGEIDKLLVTGREEFDFYAASIEILILKLRLSEDLSFVGKIITVIAAVEKSLATKSDDIEYFVAVSERLLFIMNEVLCAAPKGNLIYHKDILLPILNETMADFLVPKAKLSVNFATIEKLPPKIQQNIGIINKQKNFTKKLLTRTRNLAIEIYQLCFLLKDKEPKEEQDILIIKSAIKSLLSRIPDIRSRGGDYEVEQIGELIIQGLADYNCSELYDLLFDALYKLELECVLLDFPASSDKALFEYIEVLLQSCKESSDVDEIALLKLINSVNCIRNIRNQFAKIREKFTEVLKDYIIVYSSIFKVHNGGYESCKEHADFSEVIRKFNRISDLSIMGSEMFSYDKQYIIDNLCNFKDYCYFRNYFIPLVLGKDFNLYQENYWTEIIEHYVLNKTDLSHLFTILRNPKIYYYASNIEHLYSILSKIGQLDFTEKKDIPIRFSEILLEILSRCLILIKRSENIQINEEIKRNLISLCATLAKKFDLKSIFNKPFEGMIDGKDMLLFVLLYFYTKDNSYGFKIDYDIWFDNYPRERRDFMVTLIELFTEYDKLKKKQFEPLYPILGDGTVERIKQMLSLRVGLLNEWTVNEFENKLKK
jgi:hypothetical protein